MQGLQLLYGRSYRRVHDIMKVDESEAGSASPTGVTSDIVASCIIIMVHGPESRIMGGHGEYVNVR
jgi:hypothetical protein